MGSLRDLAKRYGLAGAEAEPYRGCTRHVRRTAEPSTWHGVGHGPWEVIVRDSRHVAVAACRGETEDKALACAQRVIDAIHGD